MSTQGPAITSLELESRRFPPPADLAAGAVATADLYDRAAADHDGFWMDQALTRLDWMTAPTLSCDRSRAPFFTWFADGVLNASVNCLDRHLDTAGERVAYHWEGEPGDTLDLTYRELHAEVCRLANGLRALGVGKGDRVAIYLGMVPEVVVAMLACTRVGAVHTVVFGGFSPDSLRDRINDCGCRCLITGDGAHRAGKVVPLKANADAALAECPGVSDCVVVRRTGGDIDWVEGRDVWYHDLVEGRDAECTPEPMGAEDPLFVLYTSGSTGKPKGIVHTTGGYL
ncbi:MAG: AMP-binding protein, partial [Miltoncostaeaceae bacterium]